MDFTPRAMPTVHSPLVEVNVTGAPSTRTVQVRTNVSSVVRVPADAMPLSPSVLPNVSVHVASMRSCAAGPLPVAPLSAYVPVSPLVSSAVALPTGAAVGCTIVVSLLEPGPPAPTVGPPPPSRLATSRTAPIATTPPASTRGSRIGRLGTRGRRPARVPSGEVTADDGPTGTCTVWNGAGTPVLAWAFAAGAFAGGGAGWSTGGGAELATAWNGVGAAPAPATARVAPTGAPAIGWNGAAASIAAWLALPRPGRPGSRRRNEGRRPPLALSAGATFAALASGFAAGVAGFAGAACAARMASWAVMGAGAAASGSGVSGSSGTTPVVYAASGRSSSDRPWKDIFGGTPVDAPDRRARDRLRYWCATSIGQPSYHDGQGSGPV